MRLIIIFQPGHNPEGSLIYNHHKVSIIIQNYEIQVFRLQFQWLVPMFKRLNPTWNCVSLSFTIGRNKRTLKTNLQFYQALSFLGFANISCFQCLLKCDKLLITASIRPLFSALSDTAACCPWERLMSGTASWRAAGCPQLWRCSSFSPPASAALTAPQWSTISTLFIM